MDPQAMAVLENKWFNLRCSYLCVMFVIAPLLLTFKTACVVWGIIAEGAIMLVYANWIERGNGSDGSQEFFAESPARTYFFVRTYLILWLTCALCMAAMYRHDAPDALMAIEFVLSSFIFALMLGRNEEARSHADHQ